MPCSLNLASIIEETRTALGSSALDVELVDADIKKALKDAVRAYNHARPRRSRAVLPVTVTQKRYVLNHVGLKGVTTVQFVQPRDVSGAQVDPFDSMTYRTGNPATPSPYGDREMVLGYIEYARTVNSSDPDWHGQWEGAEYALYVNISQSGMICGYEYTWHVQPTDDANNGLRFIDASDEDWIMDYTLARAKSTLGRIRGKFTGITNPDGSTESVDYQELQQEAREDMQRLEEALKKRRRPLPPVAG
jgi:hypothetical protein